MDEVRYKRNPDIAFRQIEGEVMAVNTRESLIYVLNPVAACIWQSLDEKTTAGQILARVCAAFEAPEESVRQDVRDFLDDLRMKNLIITA